jgi:4-amino-4-deoxy-L-arabinose transferase-like glycosyltransferase
MLKIIHSRFENKTEIIGFIFLLLLMYFPLFGHLGNLTIRIWDEARVTMNAYEMNRNGDWLVTKYMGNPDLWNTKPPLLVWIQSFMLYLTDNIEIAMRIPSALAGAATILLIFFFVRKVSGNYTGAYIAAIVLLSSRGYVDVHGTRTGDYDSLLVFFTTLSCCMIWLYTEDHKAKYLYFFFILLALAVLTKSISGLLLLPAIGLFIVYKRSLLVMLRSKHFYFGLAIFLLSTAGYYLLREMASPGYLKAVGENELWGRYMQSLEYHSEPFDFYFDQIRLHRYKAYYLFLPFGVLAGVFLMKNKQINSLSIFSTIIIISYFLIISMAKTKLFWYDLPLYPFFAILIAFFAIFLLQKSRDFSDKLKFGKYLYPAMLLIIALYLADKTYLITKRWYKPQDQYYEWNDYRLSHYLRDAVKGKHDLNHTFVLYEGYNTMLRPYIYQLQDQGIETDIQDWKKVSPGDQVLCYQPVILDFINQKFEVDTLNQTEEIITLKLIRIK